MITANNGLEIKIKRQNKYGTIRPNGFIDAYTSRSLEKTIDGLFNEGIYKIVIDCAGIEYLSIRGLDVMLRAVGRARRHKGDVILARPTPNIKKALRLLGVANTTKVAGSIKNIPSLIATN